MKRLVFAVLICMFFIGSAFAQDWKEFCKNDQRVCSYDRAGVHYPPKDNATANIKLDVRIVFTKENRVYDEQWEVNCSKRELSAGSVSKVSPSAFSKLPLYPDLNNLYEILCLKMK